MQTTASIVQLIDLFLSEHDVKDGSKSLYRNNLSLFFRWCVLNKIEPRSVRREHVVKYKQHLQESGKSTLTSNSRLTTLRLFYDWLEQSRFYSNNPVAGVKNIRTSRKYRKESLSVEHVGNLFAQVYTAKAVGKRDMSILMLMLGNGLREIEVSRLDVGDIKEQGDIYTITLWRKGRSGKDSVVRLSSLALDAISEYLADRPQQHPSYPLFTIYSNNGKGVRMGSKAISNTVNTYLRKAGLKSKMVSPHSLRHTAGTLLLESGASVYDVQQLLGHSVITTTEIYVSQIEAKRRLYNSPTVQLDAILRKNKAFDPKMANTG